MKSLANKVLSFFCAIEGGDVLNLTGAEAKEVVKQSSQMYNTVQEIIKNAGALLPDKFLRFYESEHGAYFLRFEDSVKYIIYFVPSDQKMPDEGAKISDISNTNAEYFTRLKEHKIESYYNNLAKWFSMVAELKAEDHIITNPEQSSFKTLNHIMIEDTRDAAQYFLDASAEFWMLVYDTDNTELSGSDAESS